MNKQFQLFLDKIDEDTTVFEDLRYLLATLDKKLTDDNHDFNERYLSDIIDRLFAQYTFRMSKDIVKGYKLIRKSDLK